MFTLKYIIISVGLFRGIVRKKKNEAQSEERRRRENKPIIIKLNKVTECKKKKSAHANASTGFPSKLLYRTCLVYNIEKTTW